MDKKRALADSWTKNAENWTRAVREGRIASRKAGTDAALLDAIAARKPERFLDAGCGEGFHTRAVVERTDCTATGFDASETLIAAARAADPDGQYVLLDYATFVADRNALPGPYDVIAFNYALFDEDIVPLLTAARDRLSSGGAIVVQTLHPERTGTEDGWQTEDFAGFDDRTWAPMPWYFRTISSWEETVTQAGLKITERVEPVAEPTDAPLSLLMICEAAD